jgi:hypothetical protein
MLEIPVTVQAAQQYHTDRRAAGSQYKLVAATSDTGASLHGGHYTATVTQCVLRRPWREVRPTASGFEHISDVHTFYIRTAASEPAEPILKAYWSIAAGHSLTTLLYEQLEAYLEPH